MANTKLILLEDVESLGRSGDFVTARPGFARNYLLPQQLAVIADKNALRMQDRLKEERKKQADQDKKEADSVAQSLKDVVISTIVKVDQEGHMYGSVTALDIAGLLQQHQNLELDKKCVLIKHPIKALGVHTIELKLKEGVKGSFTLKILAEGAVEEVSA